MTTERKRVTIDIPKPVAVVALESLLFLLIGLWRFSREEF
jgi:hypothetical protein